MSSGSQSSGTQSSESQSSDAAQEEPSIPFMMHRGSINPETGLGTFSLEMPQMPLLEVTSAPNNYPRILLEIKDEDQVDSLMRMKQLQHKNILAVHFFDKDGVEGVRAFVEPYTGFISDLFVDAEYFVNSETGLVPSHEFQEIVSASLDGLDCIIKNDSYHGNFSWETTVYHLEGNSGKRTLKLCNFENRKNKSLLECQLGDCHALAHSLEKVSLYVQKHSTRPETCCLIDDLARRLRSVNDMESLSTMKQENEDCVFFWDDSRKRSFYAYDMPAVWFTQSFLVSFQGSLSVPPMPWNTLWENHGLMFAMEKYRAINKIAPYKFDNLNEFLRFISGLYTHQTELKVPHLDVDSSVQLKHPRLLLDLKKAVDNQ